MAELGVVAAIIGLGIVAYLLIRKDVIAVGKAVPNAIKNSGNYIKRSFMDYLLAPATYLLNFGAMIRG